MSDNINIRLEIITPYGVFHKGLVSSVTVQLKDGEMGIMSRHTPMVVALVPGETRFLEDGIWKYCATTNGYAEIGRTLVVLVVSAAEWPENIDLKRAKRAYERAQQRYDQERDQPILERRNRHAMERALVRIKVAEKHKKNTLYDNIL